MSYKKNEKENIADAGDELSATERSGRRSDSRTVWMVVIVMTLLCIAVGVCSSVLTGYFMRRGRTLPAIEVDGDVQQNIAAVVATRKPAVAEISCGGLRGSGVAMKYENGKVYVLTNAHVLETSKNPSVRFYGVDSYYQGEVLGYNSFYDVAVVTVVHDVVDVLSEEYFSPTTEYREGDYVVAIGNAMGMGIASYDGIVSRSSEILTYNSKQVPVMRTKAESPLTSTTEDSSSHNAANDVEDTGFVMPISIVYPVYKQILDYNDGDGEVGLIDIRYFPTTNTSSIGGLIAVSLGFTCEYRRRDFLHRHVRGHDRHLPHGGRAFAVQKEYLYRREASADRQARRQYPHRRVLGYFQICFVDIKR